MGGTAEAATQTPNSLHFWYNQQEFECMCSKDRSFKEASTQYDAGDVELLEAPPPSPDHCGTILDSNLPYNMLPVDHFNLVDATPGHATPGHATLSEENEGPDDLQTILARDCRPHKRKRTPTKLVHLGPDEDDQRSSSEMQNEDDKTPLVMLPRMIDLQQTIHSRHDAGRGAFLGVTMDVMDEETSIKVETTSESPIMYDPEGSNLHSVSPGLCLPVDRMGGSKPEIEPSEVRREEEREIVDVDTNGDEMGNHEVKTYSIDNNSGNATIFPYDQADMNAHVDETYCVATASGQRRWQCRLCEKSYTSKYNLVTHILGHSGIKPHACSQCGKFFKQLSHLHTHQLTHAGARPHGCHVCGRAFTQTSHLKRHLMQHSAIRPHVCTLCGRGFAYPSELRAHEARHANEPQRPRGPICNACGLACSSAAMLKQHKALVHHEVTDNLRGQPANSNPATFCCQECGRTFQYRSQLQNHALSHCDVRPYICAECGMEFVQSHHLKQHMLIHKGIKEHKCDVCGRGFTLQANMKRHMLTHSSERQYACSLCHKAFTQKQTLKAHMIVHSEKKPFKCKVCNKEFNRLHNLMGHLHLHTTRKPFQCLHCPSKFTLKGNLTRHTKVKHGRNIGTYNGSLNPSGVTRLSSYGDRHVKAWHAGTIWQQEEPFDLSGRCWKAAGEYVRPLAEGQKSPSELQGQVDLRHCFSGVDPRDAVILGAVTYEPKYRLLTAPPFLHGTCY
uniref:histone-lysine N-methyltransferase PRDM9-like n=1 Tax=Myxine glutinosa TaxID=7769 RepID=UPI00358DEE20